MCYLRPFIIQYVSNCELEFDYVPVPNCIPKPLRPEIKFSLEEQQAIDQGIKVFLEKQIIEQCQHELEEIISIIF